MALAKFIEYLQYEKRFSRHTVTAYQTDLSQFQSYCIDNFELGNILEANYQVVRSWIVYLIEANISTRSVNRKISSLKSFYKYAKRMGLIEINPMQKILAPKTSSRLPVFVEAESMEDLFKDMPYEEGFNGTRGRLILELLYNTGIRLSELINIKDSDINFSNHTLKVLGKRNKERIIPMNSMLEQVITSYQEQKKKELDSVATPNLLVTDKGEKLYEKFVYRLVNEYLGKVTTVSKKSPHVLRHTFATHMLNNGADLNTIKEILGHANLSATQVYTHSTIEKLKNVYHQAHPKGS